MTNTGPHGSPGRSYNGASPSQPSMTPRRSSYASVVAGQASSSSTQPSQPLRAGAFSHTMNPYGPTYTPMYPEHHSRRPSGNSSISMDMVRAISTSWDSGDRLPKYSRQFLPPYLASMGTGNHFFTPSYLRNSKYVERLEEAHRAKIASQKDSHWSHSGPPSLSTSSSSVNLHKMAPSHRGMTYDIIEKEPPTTDEDTLTPLPSRWNDLDKASGLDITGDGLEVRFTGPSKSHDHEAAAVRADHPMPPQCGVYYYEVTVISKGKEGLIGIGFSGHKVQLSRLPGWEPDSWAYHGDDGFSFCCQSSGKQYGPQFSTSDVIGCGVNFRTGCAFFTKNGANLGIAFRDLKGNKLYPSVGMKKPGEHVKVNFGQTRFVFDIDGYMRSQAAEIQSEIHDASVASLHPPLDETGLIQQLVAQYLAHDGYVETARAFRKEIQSESRLLSNEKADDVTDQDVEEDLDAVNRQRIRTAILQGDIDKALKHTNAYYPTVLKDNEQIYFRLRCRKFVEMIRQCSELNSSSNKSNGRSSGGYDDIFEQDMELDEEMDDDEDSNLDDQMETEDNTADNSLKYQTLIQETIQYGQLLQSEFRDDNRLEVRNALKDTFSLLAYEDPKSSVVAHLLEPSGRVPVAEELNSAILVSLGKSSAAALEKVIKQTEVLIDQLSEEGGSGALVNVRKDFMRPKTPDSLY